jgi:ectoine hydroxylase-related dioxygenase (phytanoyl-CoA dioxygenase family)
MPSEDYIEQNKIQIVCPQGSVIFFDSTLWHAGGQNKTKNVRRAINMQWSKPFIKQQLDYPEFMKNRVDLESRLAQKLGMWTVPPKSVDEYRVSDPKLRTYRGGQG